jgi:hypothetical protein
MTEATKLLRGAAPARPARPDPRNHPLFHRYPLAGEVTLSRGRMPTPYHVYDGHGVFIGGSADLAAVRGLLAPAQVQAVQTERGEALMGVWLFDFSDASLGPHHELQLSLFVARDPLPPVTAHPLGLLELMVARPDVLMLCHGLWNNTSRVVAYNRELLALDARLSRSRIERGADTLAFEVRDDASGASIVEGAVQRTRRSTLRTNIALVRLLGLRRLLALARQPWISMPVVNPVGVALDRNAEADTHTKVDAPRLRSFEPARDRLQFGDTRYRALRFRPRFFQVMDGFKFVYRLPR